jgi:hypothetical protein
VDASKVLKEAYGYSDAVAVEIIWQRLVDQLPQQSHANGGASQHKEKETHE